MTSEQLSPRDYQRVEANAKRMMAILQCIQFLPAGIDLGELPGLLGQFFGICDSDKHEDALALVRQVLAQLDRLLDDVGGSEALLAIKTAVASSAYSTAMRVERFQLAREYADIEIGIHQHLQASGRAYARALNNRALANQELVRMTEAEADYLSALDWMDKETDRDSDWTTLRQQIVDNYGTLRTQRGETPLLSTDQLHSTRDLPWSSIVGGEYATLVGRLTARGVDVQKAVGPEAALPLLKDAYDLAERGRLAPKDHGIAASNLGDCLVRLKRPTEAVEVLKRAKAIHAGVSGCQQPYAIDCYTLGLAYQELKLYEQVLAEFKAGWDAIRPVAPRSLAALYLLSGLGLYRMYFKDNQRARAVFSKGLEIYESMRPDLADTEDKHEDVFKAYRGLLQRFLWLSDREDWTDEICLLVERGKARFWLEAMSRTRSGSSGPVATSDADGVPLSSDVAHATVAPVAPTVTPMAMYDQRRLRDLLGNKGILFHFFVGPDDTFVSFSSQGLLDHYRLDLSEAQLREQVAGYLSSFGTFNTRRVRGLGSCPPPSHSAVMRQFGEMLFPVAKSLFDGARQVVVMPDGPLWSLPFDSLELPMSDGWRRLGELAPVFVAPSIAALQQFRTQGKASLLQTDTVLIVAEPATGPSVPALPGARREAAWLRQAVSTAGRTIWFEGDEPTPDVVKPHMESASHVHIASHAYGDPADGVPHLLLTDGKGSAAKLAAHEIAQLRMNAKLVYLSACSTSMGKPSTGEGLVSLARAFLMAGTRCVVASLWPVDDDEAVSIARWFYEAYLSGQSPARAMYLAKQRVLQQGADHSTVSAFQVFGDGA